MKDVDQLDELLFLSNLYNTWPWYYDTQAQLNIKNKIIHFQHRTITKIKLERDKHLIIHQRPKTKTKKKTKAFGGAVGREAYIYY